MRLIHPLCQVVLRINSIELSHQAQTTLKNCAKSLFEQVANNEKYPSTRSLLKPESIDVQMVGRRRYLANKMLVFSLVFIFSAGFVSAFTGTASTLMTNFKLVSKSPHLESYSRRSSAPLNVPTRLWSRGMASVRMVDAVPVTLDPTLTALLVQWSVTRVSKDLERAGLGPPRGGSTPIAYRRGKILPANLPRLSSGLQFLRRARTTTAAVVDTVKSHPVRGTSTLIRTVAASMAIRRLHEEDVVRAEGQTNSEEFPAQTLLDELGSQVIEQVRISFSHEFGNWMVD